MTRQECLEYLFLLAQSVGKRTAECLLITGKYGEESEKIFADGYNAGFKETEEAALKKMQELKTRKLAN